MSSHAAPPGAPEPPSRARLLAYSALTTALTLIVIVGALELGARLYLGAEFVPGLPMGRPVEATAVFDPDLGWRNRPGVRTRVVAPTFSYEVAINSRGLRDDEHPYEKPAGVKRVLFLGDSMTWAWGVEQEEGFVQLVEEALGARVEAVNLAVPGYGTDQELWTLEREGLRYEPDLVVLCFILNDVVGNHAVRGHGIAHEKPRYVREDGEWRIENRPVPEPEHSLVALSLGPYRWLWSHSAFLHLVLPADLERQLVEERRTQLEAADAGDEPQGGEAAAVRAMCDELVEEGSVTAMLLGRLSERCREAGVPLVAFSLPHGHDRFLYAADWLRPEVLERAGVRPGVPFRSHLATRLAEAGERFGFRTFSVDQDLLDAMAARRVDLHVGDGHLNALGNRVVAERVAAELAPLLGVEPPAPAGAER